MKQNLANGDDQKWEMLLNLLEHPEKYSDTQKDEFLNDEEVRELYQQLVETREALDFGKSKEGMRMPDVSEEWERALSEERRSLWSPMRKVAAVAAVLVVSGIAFAAIHLATRAHRPSEPVDTEVVAQGKDSTSHALTKTTHEKADTAIVAKMPLIYENVELQDILQPIAEHYHLQVTYQNESARHIRLYLQLTEGMSLDDILDLMNHFEKVNVRQDGNMLVVE